METEIIPIDELQANATISINSTCLGAAFFDLVFGRPVIIQNCGIVSFIAAWLERPVEISVWPLEATLPWSSVGDVVDQAGDVAASAHEYPDHHHPTYTWYAGDILGFLFALSLFSCLLAVIFAPTFEQTVLAPTPPKKEDADDP